MLERVPATPPRPDRSWGLINRTVIAEDGPNVRCAAPHPVLQLLSKQDLFAFDCDYWRMIDGAYRGDVRVVACITSGGASDDGFDRLRVRPLSSGRRVYKGSLGDPETFIYMSEPCEAENKSVRSAEQEVYEAKCGAELPRSHLKAPTQPASKAWHVDALEFFPKLSAWVDANG
ncbi:MAG: DUF4240 domain-containing protein [Pseudomonadota bacterium]